MTAMILTCDVCQTTYHADAAAIGAAGRQVKCASCGHSWFVAPDGASAGPEPVATSADKRYLRTVHERQVKRSRLAAIGAWGVAGALALLVVAGALLGRETLVERWPRLASTYAAIGLPVNRFGVEFENVERRRDLVGTVPVLTVAANVRNTSGRPRPAPRVRIGLIDTHGQRIAEIETDVTPAIIAPGQSGRFEAVMENPPADSYSLDLRFAPGPGDARLADRGAATEGPRR